MAAGVIFGFVIGAPVFLRALGRESGNTYAAVTRRDLQGKTGSARAVRFSDNLTFYILTRQSFNK